MKVPLLDLQAQYAPIMDEIKFEFDKVFTMHSYILGPQVREFEKQMEAFHGVKHAIGCASGSDALVLALKVLGVGAEDEVLTTPFTFFASAGAVHRVGATARFADIDPDTYNLDPAKIEAALTPRTKAIIPVHLFGQPCDMDAIMAVAKKHGIPVIEDNAQGVGAKWNGKVAGTIGDIGTLSFFPSKNLGAMGDGGMCLTNDDDLAALLRQMRVHGENPKYFHKYIGLNSRLDSLQAVALSVKLPHLPAWSEARRRNAAYYNERLQGIPGVKTPVIHPLAETIYNQYTLAVEDREGLMAALQSAGIGCAIYYPLPLHMQECFSMLGYQEGDLPVSEKAAKQVVSIPIYSELTHEQQDYVIEAIRSYYNR
jgi:dTDP-4-amino-4,6-dideoxygalactose transaminase